MVVLIISLQKMINRIIQDPYRKSLVLVLKQSEEKF